MRQSRRSVADSDGFLVGNRWILLGDHHTLGRILALDLDELRLHALAEAGVDVAPVLQRPAEDRLDHTVGEVAGDVADQALTSSVVEHLTNHGAGLAPVVVLGCSAAAVRAISPSTSQLAICP